MDNGLTCDPASPALPHRPCLADLARCTSRTFPTSRADGAWGTGRAPGPAESVCAGRAGPEMAKAEARILAGESVEGAPERVVLGRERDCLERRVG